MIAIPSISKEEEMVANYLQDYIASDGIIAQRKGNNLWCMSPNFDAQKPTLCLNSHIDTVKPVTGWKHHPYTAKIEEDRLYGLGSNDAGASVVCLYQAYKQLIQKEQAYNLVLLLSCEEEISGKNGIEEVLQLLPPFDLVLVGEPTEMQPAIAEKGLMVIDALTQGVAGHAARLNGINAIYKAMKDIEILRHYSFEKQSSLLGKVQMSITQIEAGTQHNVIPDACRFVIDVRSNECYSNQEIHQILEQQIESTLTPRSFRLNSSRISLNHPIVQRAIAMNRQPFGSPTLSDQALISYPSLKIGPGHSDRSHTADEYILLSEIDQGIRLYTHLLDGLILKV
jgi:acetylornithine deacetylase